MLQGMGEDVYDGDHPDTDVLDTEEPHSPHSPHHHVLMPHLPNSEPVREHTHRLLFAQHHSHGFYRNHDSQSYLCSQSGT